MSKFGLARRTLASADCRNQTPALKARKPALTFEHQVINGDCLKNSALKNEGTSTKEQSENYSSRHPAE